MATQNLAIIIFLPLIIILVLIGIVYLLMRSSREKSTHPSSPPAEYSDTSLDELEIRFVKGEINEEEYREIKDILEE